MGTQLDVAESAELGLGRFTASIDRDGEIPIGVQLGWALRGSIREGRFSPGQRLPALRELAEAVAVNVNTVRAVYQRLEREGLIASRQGSGTFVAEKPSEPSAVASIAADAAREALATGSDPREVAAALYVAPPQEHSQSAARSPSVAVDEPTAAATRRRALRAQIATLERAIGEIEAEYPGVAPRPEPPSATRRTPGPTLLSTQELERVRSGLVRRLATVQAAIDERAVEAQPAAQEPVPTTADPAPARMLRTVALATP